MADQLPDIERLSDLRRRAAARLAGTSGTHRVPGSVTDALSVLHALASSPQTAPDALALLHELQVHQVELDLQAQELRESRAELESALRRQLELHDCQPVGLITVDHGLVIQDLNLTGAGMLGLERDQACGVSLAGFFGAEDMRRLMSAVARAGSARLTLRPRRGPERQVLASTGRDPAATGYLMSLATTEEAWHGPAGGP